MAARRMGIMAWLICLCLCLLPCGVQAVSTADAREPISVDQACQLTLCYGYDGEAFQDVAVKLYRIADVSPGCLYSLTDAFQSSGLTLNGIQTSGEWTVIRETLEALCLRLEPDHTGATAENGQVVFDALMPGLYLAVPGDVSRDDTVYLFDSALISLPGLGTDGLWNYPITVAAKGSPLPPISPDETVTYKVLKLWKGDDHKTGRPKSIEVEIFRNGTHYQTVTLSEENLWSFSWTVSADNARWLVLERNVPDGYAMTIEEKDNTFVLTNIRLPDPPGVKPHHPHKGPPRTGDTSNILLYTILLYASGIMLILLGSRRKRKHV